MKGIKEMDRYNLLGVYDVLIDIKREKQLSSSNIQVPILKNPVEFIELFPADSIPLRDRYCELRWKIIKLLKEKGIIKEYKLIDLHRHRWLNRVQVVIDEKSFEHIFGEIEKEFESAEESKGKEETGNIDFWDILHPKIIEVSKSRFESGHYSDAVEAAFKEINSIIKAIVKEKTGHEYDGADLMNRAFSLKNPYITLDDLSTETGKNIQLGYLQIFAGSIIGIRNPKAHHNIAINSKRAIHLLYLASLLLHKIDERK